MGLVARHTRTSSGDAGTFGVITLGRFRCFTLELPWRDNRPRRSCIPVGTYRCGIVQSPKFGRVYQVFDVPGRSAILIHPANFAGDVDLGLDSQLHGCIALGMRLGAIRNKAGAMQPVVAVSRPAVSAFMAEAKGEPFTLEVS